VSEDVRPSSDDALVLFGGYVPGDVLRFVRIASRSGGVVARGALTDMPSGPAARRIVLLLAGVEAQVKRVDIQARSEAQARAAAPHLLRGAIAAAPETMHYAIGDAIDDAGGRLVAVIAAERLRHWIEVCARHGFEPQSALVDCTVWPTPPGVVSVVETPPLTLVSGGAGGGYSIETALAPALFGRWYDGVRGEARSIRLSTDDPGAWRAALSGASVEDAREDDPFAALAAAAIDSPEYAPELLQGPYARSEKNGGGLSLGVWRLAAVLGLIAVLLQVGLLVFAGLRDGRAARETLALAESDFRAARPDVRRIVNLRAQVKALLNASEQSKNHPVLALSDPLIAMVEANPLVRIDGVRHAAPGRRVIVQASSTDLQALNEAAQSLRAHGVSVTARDLQPIDGRHANEWEFEVP